MRARRVVETLVAGLLSFVALAGCAPASPEIDELADDVDSAEQAAGSCDPYAPRDPAPEVLVGPHDFEPALLALIDGAKTSIDVMIYQLSRPSFITALANAAKRGVAVRVLVDPDEDLTASHEAKLESAGVEVKARAKAGVPTRVLLASPGWIPSNAKVAAELIAAGAEARFFTSLELHAKLIVTDAAAFVGSENLSYTALNKNREVGVFVTEPEALAPIDAQLEADWADGIAPD